MSFQAPENRVVLALRPDPLFGPPAPSVVLVCRGGREIHFALESATATAAQLIAASVLASGLLDQVSVPSLVSAIHREISGQLAFQKREQELAELILKAHGEAA